MTAITTIMVSGKNTGFPVTCLDLLCCANSCRAFSLKSTSASWFLYPVVLSGLQNLRHRGTGKCVRLPVMIAAWVSMRSLVARKLWMLLCKNANRSIPVKSGPNKRVPPSSCFSIHNIEQIQMSPGSPILEF